MEKACDLEEKTDDDNKNQEGHFYSDNNIRYLEGILQDIKNGKARFSEHELLTDAIEEARKDAGEDPWATVRQVIGTFPDDFMADRGQPSLEMDRFQGVTEE
mgnify:CR=1 FL=1